MERRTYATILLLVLGIIEVYSFPSESHPTDAVLSRRASAGEEQPRSSLQTILHGHDDHERIKRDDRARMQATQEPQGNREARRLNLIRGATEMDIRRDIIAVMVRERQATTAQLTSIVDSYMRQYNMNRAQATAQFRRDHPTLTRQFLPGPQL